MDWAELRRGLARARPFLLSHHRPARRYRCYRLRPFGYRIDLCARCSGVYPGILLGILGYLSAFRVAASLTLVVVLPLPALLDWLLTSLGDYRGSNVVRTITGALLGYGYGLGLAYLFLADDRRVLAVGIVYAVLAGAGVLVRQRSAGT